MPKEDQDALAQKLDKETALRIAIEDKLVQTEAVLAKKLRAGQAEMEL